MVSLHNTSTSSGPMESKYIHTTLHESKNQLITVEVINVGMLLEVQSETYGEYADYVHGLNEGFGSASTTLGIHARKKATTCS